MKAELLLHFLRFDIQSQSLDVEDWLDRLYVSNDLTVRFPGHSATLTLCFERKDAAPSIEPPAHAVFAETNLCGSPCYYADGRFYAADHGAIWHELVYDLSSHTIQARLGGEYLWNSQTIISNLIRPILQSFVLPFYRLKSLHGAIVHKNGQTVFLAGQGRAGKTTTAIGLMHAGFDVLSDDGPLFTTDGERAFALSSLDYLHATERTLQLFPNLRTRISGGLDARDKYALPLYHARTAGSWTEAHEVTHYIQLRRGEVSAPQLRRLDRGAVHQQLISECMVIFRHPHIRTSPYPFRAHSEFILDLVAKMIRPAKVYELEFANHHLPQLPAMIEQL